LTGEKRSSEKLEGQEIERIRIASQRPTTVGKENRSRRSGDAKSKKERGYPTGGNLCGPCCQGGAEEERGPSIKDGAEKKKILIIVKRERRMD